MSRVTNRTTGRDRPATAAPPGSGHRGLALAAVLTAEAMNLLDTTIVQVAGPVIHTDLGGARETIPWFSAAYTLAFALGLPTGARLGDIAGRRRVFRVGVVVFAVASLACALAPGAATLIALRAVQGAAAAAVIPQTFGLIRAMYEGGELTRALGMIGPVMGLSAVLGPVLGGVLTHADVFGSSWRAVFLVNLPPAAAVLAASVFLTEDRAPARPRPDPAGTVLALLGTALVVCPLASGSPGPARWALAAAGAAVLGVFVVHQRRADRRGHAPLIEPALLRGRAFPAALATSALFFAVMNGVMITVVLHLELGLRDGPLTAGLTLLPWSVGLATGSWAAGTHLVTRYGTRVMHTGIAVLATGLAAAVLAYRGADPGSYPAALPAALAVAGLGTGLFTPPFFSTAISGVGHQETGSAAGLLNAVQQLGGTVGVAVVGGVYLGVSGDARTAAEHALVTASAVLAAAAVAAAVMTSRHADR
ncbi:MFS transporter [Streptomyces populi]